MPPCAAPAADATTAADAPTAAPADAAPEADARGCPQATVNQPFTIANGIDGFVRFELAEGQIYFATHDSFARAVAASPASSRSCGAVQVLWSPEGESGDLVIAAQEAYYTTRDFGATVKAVPRAGGPARVVLDHYPYANDPAGDDQRLYVVATYPEIQIVAFSPAGGAEAILAEGESLWQPSHLRVDQGSLHHMNAKGLWGSRIERVPVAGGPVEMVAMN
jgi:hypothetical protein